MVGSLTADAATFVTPPTRTVGGKVLPNAALDDRLWTAVKHDSIAAFEEIPVDRGAGGYAMI